MARLTLLLRGAPMSATESAAVDQYQDLMLPVAVVITTLDFEIEGVVYVSRQTEAHRRISDLLNNSARQFLAVKDVRLIHRKQPSSPRFYEYLHVNVEHVVMMHPAAQASLNNTLYSDGDTERFDRFREKLQD